MAAETFQSDAGTNLWDEQIWVDLLDYIEAGEVIPVVGPELLQVEVAGAEVLLDRYLAGRLAEAYLQPSERPPADASLNRVVYQVLRRDKSLRERLYTAIRRIVVSTPLGPPRALRQLAAIRPFKLFVTVSFDSLLEKAIDSERFGGREETQTLAFWPRKSEDLPCPKEDLERPTVYHLLGKLSTSPEYVICDEDLLEFVVALQSDRRPERLFDELDRNHLLVLGGSFSDWLARFFLRATKRLRLSDPRYFLDIVADSRTAREANLVLFLKQFSSGTRVFGGSGAAEFVDELWRRWSQRHPEPPAHELPPPPDVMPKGAIFISYFHEDGAAAQTLYNGLTAAGLPVWFDKKQLKGGAKFNDKIKTYIDHDCSCFVPLLSQNADRCPESYFRREWALAVQRSAEFGLHTPFIVPVVIDQSGVKEFKDVPSEFRDLGWNFMPGGEVTPEFVEHMREIVKNFHARGQGEGILVNAIRDSSDLLRPEVGRDRPWPGLTAYTKEMHEYFHGREQETDDLFRRLRRRVLTVLFGQSGLGKTSLLQAGLFPMLRRERYLPVPIRLDYETSSSGPKGQDLSAQVKAAIRRAVEDAGLPRWGSPQPEETLWEYFHRRRDGQEGPGEESVRLALVFDQFEELFTLGKPGSGGVKDSPATGPFLVEIADLIEERAPDVLKQRFEENPELIERFAFERQDYRVLFCLREEWLPHLEDLRELLPSVAQNRMRLTPMTGLQALDAVLLPGAGLVSPEVGEQIVRFVAKAGADAGLADLNVDPSLLSLVCSELNERRLDLGLPQITRDLVADTSGRILQDFYEGCLVNQAPAVRAFVEERLLTDSGYRENMALETARKELAALGAPESAIDRLVEHRLLHLEDRLGVQRVELTHDRLAPVIQASRDQRRQQDRARQAEEREKELRERLRKSRKKLVRTAAWMAGLILVISTFLIFSIIEWHSAVLSREAAIEAEETALTERANAESSAQKAKTAERALAEFAGDVLSIILGSLQGTCREAPSMLGPVDACSDLPSASSRLFEATNHRLDVLQKTAPTSVDALRNLDTLNWAATLDLAVTVAKKKEVVLEVYKKALDLADEQAQKTSDATAQSTAMRAYAIISESLASWDSEQALRACDRGIATATRGAAARVERAAYWASRLHSIRGEVLLGSVQVGGSVAGGAPAPPAPVVTPAPAVPPAASVPSPDDKKTLEALEAFQSALKWAEAAAADENDDPEACFERPRLLERIGGLHRRRGRTTEALDAYRKAKNALVRLWTASGTRANRKAMAYALQRVGGILKGFKDFDNAAEAYETLRKVREAIIASDPSTTVFGVRYKSQQALSDVEAAYRDIGLLEMDRGDALSAENNPAAARQAYANAEKAFRGALTYAQKGAAGDDSWMFMRAVPSCWADVGRALEKQRKLSEAEAAYKEGLKAIEDAAARGLVVQSDLSDLYRRLGLVQLSQHKLAEAIDSYVRRLDVCRALRKQNDNPQTRKDLVEALGELAVAELSNRQPREAIALCEEALRIDPDQLWIRIQLAHGYLFDDQFEKAKAIYEKYKDNKLGEGQTCAERALEDFRWFRDAGVTHPDMQRIEALFKKPPATVEKKPAEKAEKKG